jgi:hypothetical protein
VNTSVADTEDILSSDSWSSQNFFVRRTWPTKMMARCFHCEGRPSYSALKELMNIRQYTGLFPRHFLTIVAVQRITEKKTVILFLICEEGEV